MNNQQKASDPNTPLKELFYLGEDYPLELIKNPVFPLIPLENPNFLDEMPVETIYSLLSRKLCPKWFIELVYLRFNIMMTILFIAKVRPRFWNELRVKYPNRLITLTNTRLARLEFENVNLSNIDFSQSKLSCMTFEKVNLNNSNLSQCNIAHINFASNYLFNVNFHKADMDLVNFSNATLKNCNFTEAKLFRVNFDNTTFIDCNFADARLQITTINNKKG